MTHTVGSSGTRREVSVQKIISCPAEGSDTQRGCNGGNMVIFSEAAKAWGLTREEDNTYSCEQSSTACSSFPWGGSCTGGPYLPYLFGGSGAISGATDIAAANSQGYALYASLDVYDNFFSWGSAIYTSAVGAYAGGHAVVILGFGTDSGTDHWVFQNSWGTGWGDNGFAKIQRGVNTVSIEEQAYVPRAWVQGTAEPMCMDSNDQSGSGLTRGGAIITCSQAASENLCASWATVRSRCMVSCGTCYSSYGPTTTTPSPTYFTAAPTPPPTPVPTLAPPTPAGC